MSKLINMEINERLVKIKEYLLKLINPKKYYAKKTLDLVIKLNKYFKKMREIQKWKYQEPVIHMYIDLIANKRRVTYDDGGVMFNIEQLKSDLECYRAYYEVTQKAIKHYKL